MISDGSHPNRTRQISVVENERILLSKSDRLYSDIVSSASCCVSSPKEQAPTLPIFWLRDQTSRVGLRDTLMSLRSSFEEFLCSSARCSSLFRLNRGLRCIYKLSWRGLPNSRLSPRAVRLAWAGQKKWGTNSTRL